MEARGGLGEGWGVVSEVGEVGGREPVTMIVGRRVRRGEEARYEEWLAGLQEAVRPFEGYLGVETLRPSGDAREYVSIYRFASYEALRRWEDSRERRAWMERVPTDAVESDANVRRAEGLEYWFTPPPGRTEKPVRWRMALVTVVVVYAFIVVLSPIAQLALPWMPFHGRLAITLVVEVALMTYVVMPPLTRSLGRWLYRGP